MSFWLLAFLVAVITWDITQKGRLVGTKATSQGPLPTWQALPLLPAQESRISPRRYSGDIVNYDARLAHRQLSPQQEPPRKVNNLRTFRPSLVHKDP
jgi:hypothetical protein